MNRDIFILREKVTKLIPLLVGKGIKVTQRGSMAYVESTKDGVPMRVNIPYIPDNAPLNLIAAIEGFLDHEVGHVLFTDFRVTAKAFAVGQKQAVLQNIIEDPWVEKKMQQKFPGSAANIHSVQMFLLDEYITPMLDKIESPGHAMKFLAVPMFRAWAGQQVFIDFMADKWSMVTPFVEQIGDLALEVKKVNSTQDCFNLAEKILLAIKRDMEMPEMPCKDGDESDDPKEGKSSKEKSKNKDKSKSDENDDGDDSDEPSSMPDPFDDTPPEESDNRECEGDNSDEENDDNAKSEDKGAEDKDAEDKGEDGSDATEDKDAEDKGEDGSDATEDKGDKGGEGSDGEVEVKSDAEKAAEEAATAEAKRARDRAEAIDDILRGTMDFDDSVSETLTERMAAVCKSADYLLYTKDFDKIEPFKVNDVTSALREVTRVEEEIRPIIGVMQKGLERYIAAQSRVVHIPGYKSGRIHQAALSRMLLGDDRVFRRRQEHKSKETAVTLLIDCSGSMGQKISYASGGQRRIDVASDAAYALATVLERIGVKFEALGFTTNGYGTASLPIEIHREMKAESDKTGAKFSRYEPIYMPIFKTFGERMTSETKARFAAMKTELGLYNNVDGECVEYAARRLALCREVRKILIVLSDGEPAAQGEWYQQDANLKSTVKDVEKSGIEVLGIGIATDSVKEYYKKNLVINNVGELPAVLMSKIAELLRS